MKYEASCGAVVFTRINNQIRYVLIRSKSGAWGFPKGHMEHEETETETAAREIREETGLTPRLMPEFRKTDTYLLPKKRNVEKTVVYFLAEYENQTISYCRRELSDAKLMTFDEAISALRIESLREILKKADRYIMQNWAETE